MGRQRRDRIGFAAPAVLALLLAACTGGEAGPGPDTTTLTASTAGSTTLVDAPTSTGPATTSPPTVAPTSAPPTTTPPPDYQVTITRTEHGIPHIVADDWGSLGYGQGYAFAQDRACTLIDQVIKVRGERSRWFGAGPDDEHLNSDLAYRHLGLHEDADERFAAVPERIADVVEGYVHGFNAALEAEGPNGWCEGERWVQRITTTDLYAYLNDVLLFASSGVLLGPIATAQPPQPTAAGAPAEPAQSAEPASSEAPTATGSGLFRPRGEVGSNGWAIGSALSAGGGGILLANPHFPWEGERRLWENQLTLNTGELDVYGATLSGVPGVLIGFNEHVAWTHTVSAGHRMTLYELSLVPGDPTSFTYGDTVEQLTSEEITVQVLQADGTTSPVTRTMWRSHHGPMLQLPFGWTTERAYTFRDANIDNTHALEQFFGMGAARSLDEFVDAHRRSQGIPWVNTIAVSADGRAWYADTAVTPNLSPEAIARWQQQVADGGLASVVLDNGAILLDGSDPVNEWVDDPATARPGILPFEAMPQLERDDFVFNANDSHWLANPAELLTGFSPLTGPEAVPQSARTRMNAVLLTDPAVRGEDGLLSAAEVQAALLSQRGLHAELLKDAVVTTCERTHLVLVDEVPYDISEACAVLRAWDGRVGVSSVGAALWREYMAQFTDAERTDVGRLYKVGFDPADPVGTPNTFDDDVDQIVLSPLGLAAKRLVAAGFPLSTPLGDLQFDGRPVDDPTPLPGGTEAEGTASIVGCCSDASATAPRGDPGVELPDLIASTRGYPVTSGNSFILTVEFTEDGPRADALLTYGQLDDLGDPTATAQTALHSAGTFRRVLFTAAEVAAGAIGEPLELTGSR